MEHLILSLLIVLVAMSNLITTITVNKRINKLESFVKQVDFDLSVVACILKDKEDKKNKHEI